MSLPDFLIIGAMKCGTSTLQAQLVAHPEIFMTSPKEPNFFSDDEIFARGIDWYKALFAPARTGDIKGEASTHYSKLPTYPDCLDRLANTLKTPKLIYLIRDPIARAVSHYLHNWTMGEVAADIDQALQQHPELIEYGQYARQIAPYVGRFGTDQIKIFCLEDMRRAPQDMLTEIGEFLGCKAPVIWQENLGRMNTGSERTRRFPLHGLMFDNRVATWLRRSLIPQSVRDRIKSGRQLKQAPQFSPESIRYLQDVFTQDYAHLVRLFPNSDHLIASYPFISP